jgi:FAD/FMN-containing dehydrogenase
MNEETDMTALEDAARRLAPLLGDRVLAPDAAAYRETAALAFGTGTPALIARPRDAEEVAAVVRTAAETGAPFAVRGGGHSYAAVSSIEGGLVLDTRLMDAVRIDPGSRRGVAGGGTLAGRFTAAAAEHRLAVGFGDTTTVGITGLALGGGIGFLSRRDGLTLDNVLGATVVLADGNVVRADAGENAELFWALRGGGGNFGVVTELELRLTPTDAVTSGFLIFEPRAETVSALLEAAATAPDELSLMVNVMKAPPVPFLPAERRGTPIVVAVVCHSGRLDEADAVLAPFRAAGSLLADTVHAQPYPALLRAEEPGLHASIRTGFGGGLTLERAQAAIDLVARARSELAVVNMRPMGGAIGRVPAAATAFAHRSSPVMLSVVAVDRADAAGAAEWTGEAAVAAGLGEGPRYVNFIGEAVADAAGDAYPQPTLDRLRRVKRAFDPGNLFRSNINVEP